MRKENKDLRLQEYREIFNQYPMILVYHYNTLVYNHTTLDEAKQNLLNELEKQNISQELCVSVKVVKNTLVREAIKNTIYKNASNLFTGPTLLLYSNNASPKLCDVLLNWKKQYSMLHLLGCKYYNSFITSSDFEDMAKLPNNKGDVVQHMLGILQSPVIELTSLLSINQNVLCNTLAMQEEINNQPN
uniref:Ribosomal protein L10 n=1 Tax=Histiona aroides TaxID=392300 RepID=M4Q9E3_HISAR|nr:ribosomal protein L10 [Histiona aroides]AGH24037.1 ribosomal protein L10 [Histiona aroides]